jgi:hypothetical protein
LKRLAQEVGSEEARRRQRAFENRRRLKNPLGKRLLSRRGQTIERSFAHVCETGGLRRLHLRGRQNISKRYQVHVGTANLGTILRRLIGTGTPEGCREEEAFFALSASCSFFRAGCPLSLS